MGWMLACMGVRTDTRCTEFASHVSQSSLVCSSPTRTNSPLKRAAKRIARSGRYLEVLHRYANCAVLVPAVAHLRASPTKQQPPTTRNQSRARLSTRRVSRHISRAPVLSFTMAMIAWKLPAYMSLVTSSKEMQRSRGSPHGGAIAGSSRTLGNA